MDEKTERATELIATQLREILKSKGKNAQKMIDAGINKQQVFSVLRMGKTQRPDYKISTFIRMIHEAGAKLEITSLNSKK